MKSNWLFCRHGYPFEIKGGSASKVAWFANRAEWFANQVTGAYYVWKYPVYKPGRVVLKQKAFLPLKCHTDQTWCRRAAACTASHVAGITKTESKAPMRTACLNIDQEAFLAFEYRNRKVRE